MAKNRYGRKKSGKHKSRKRVAAGKRNWAAKVRRYGSKAAAIAATFGKRHRKGKRTKRYRRGGYRRAHHTSHYNPNLARRFARSPARVLAMIQKREGTTGMPATKAEERLARIVVSRANRAPKAAMTPEERREAEWKRRAVEFKERIAREMRGEAARRAHAKKAREYAERHHKEAEARRAEDEAAIEAELRAMG